MRDPNPSYPAPSHGAAATQPYNFQSAFFSLKGRLVRQHFWISYLILYIATLAFSLIPGVNMIASFVILWGKFAVNIKRLHDMGRSSWFAAIPLGLSFISLLIALSSIAQFLGIVLSGPRGDTSPYFQGMFVNAGLVVLLNLANLGFLIWLGITDSQRGENSHGPDPKLPIPSNHAH